MVYFDREKESVTFYVPLAMLRESLRTVVGEKGEPYCWIRGNMMQRAFEGRPRPQSENINVVLTEGSKNHYYNVTDMVTFAGGDCQLYLKLKEKVES